MCCVITHFATTYTDECIASLQSNTSPPPAYPNNQSCYNARNSSKEWESLPTEPEKNRRHLIDLRKNFIIGRIVQIASIVLAIAVAVLILSGYIPALPMGVFLIGLAVVSIVGSTIYARKADIKFKEYFNKKESEPEETSRPPRTYITTEDDSGTEEL
jgi:hypothetical protein